MNIAGIAGSIGNVGAGAGAQSAASTSQQASDAFSGVLSSLSGAQGAADSAVTDIALGSNKDLHDAVLAVQMESLSFDLAVQIRNRLVDSYQEMFRMSV